MWGGRPIYGKYSSIYIGVTSNVKDMLKLYGGYENVLSVGGTGAIGYEALLNGAKHVDLFDINELQRIFFEYMKIAIKYLSYEEFIKYFTLKEQKMIFKKNEIKDLLSQELYWKLEFLLPEDVETVLSPLFEFYDSPDLILSALFRFEHTLTLDYLK